MSDAHAPRPARRSWLEVDRDLIVSLSAITISACALGVSLFQAVRMTGQQHAAVWPRLISALTVDVRPESLMVDKMSPDSLTLTVRNAGVGPAQVEWAQVTVDGTPIDGWPALVRLAAAGARLDSAHAAVEYNSLTGGVLVPGERYVALRLAGAPARVVYAAAARVGLRVCYCSVFDRCWRLDEPAINAPVATSRPTPVPACPRPNTPVV